MKQIKVNYCIEDLRYKVFGLFPYFDKDSNGKLVLYSGDSAVDGCFNKISCAIKLPVDFIVNNKIILTAGEIYNYKTLSRLYNANKSLKNNDFIEFMKKGIGCIKVTANIDFDDCPLVPEEVNIAECCDMHDKMYKMKILCDAYEEKKAAEGKINCDLECLVSKYHDMGGDEMLAFYKSKASLRATIADEYLSYAAPDYTHYAIGLCFTAECHDMGTSDNYTDIWDYTTSYNKGDLVWYNGYTYICKEDNPAPIWDDTNCVYVMDETKFESIKDAMSDVTIQSHTDSKLKSFIGIQHYTNVLGEVESPEEGTDWLRFYKIGNIANHNVLRDENNNIDVYDGATRKTDIDGTYETNLQAFGDVITNITHSEDSLIFEYVIGAHLKAKLVKIDITDLNQPLYYYDKFVIDTDDIYHGVKYTETYSLTVGSEIFDLIDDGKFETFVTTDNIPGYEYFKGEFDLFDNVNINTTYINGTPYQYNYIPATIESTANHDETTEYPLIRQDYYDSCAFMPKVTNKVRFSRGNTAAFERHLKLGEVKSFDDFQNYANGGFFNIKS